MKITRRITIIFSLSLLVIIGGCANKIQQNHFLIQEGYVGWVYVIFDQNGFEPIKEEKRKRIFNIDSSGILKTSTPKPAYGANDKYYYAAKNGSTKELAVGTMIHYSGVLDKQTETKTYPQVVAFFVGPKERAEAAGQAQYPLN